MAFGLKALIGPAPSPARHAGLAGVILLVLAVHGWLTQQVVDRIADIHNDTTKLERIEVVYVREMMMAAPAVAAPAAPPAAEAPRVVRSKAAKPARVASAPQEPVEPVLAAGPPVPEPVVLPVPDPAAPLVVPDPPVSVPEPDPVPAPMSEPMLAAASAPPDAASAPAAFAWPSSTRVSYLLTGYFRGDVNGSAQVEWIRSGSRYQVHLDLVVGPSVAPLITRRMSSDGEISAEGLSPRRYEQDTKVVLRNRSIVGLSFEPGSVVLANGERRDTVPGVQDTASQFVQLMYVFSTRPEQLRVGNTVEIPLALPHKVDVWTYDVVAEEVLNAPFGPLPTIHLQPRRSVLRPNELSAEIWFAPQLRFFPVRIVIRQDAETFIDLMISKRPELAG
ncbi:MAG: DUF3108 domain-containing protein [Burkholderiales bacterium]